MGTSSPGGNRIQVGDGGLIEVSGGGGGRVGGRVARHANPILRLLLLPSRIRMIADLARILGVPYCWRYRKANVWFVTR